jgi:hypothetical protein
MNGKGTALFDPHTACLTEQAIYDYLDGKLLPQESHAVEKHLLDCAFCSEAMEGLELVKDRSKVMAALPITGTQEEEDTKDSGGRIRPLYFNTRFAIAAVIILLIGSFVVLKYTMGDFEKKAMLSENSSAEKTDTTRNGIVTSDDETFYKHFEPFPANETPEKKPENEAERKENGEANPVFNWTASNSRQPAQDLTLSPSPASGTKAVPEEVTLRQSDANNSASEPKTVLTPAAEPVAAFKQEKEKDESGKMANRSESQPQTKTIEVDKVQATVATEHASKAPAANKGNSTGAKNDKKQAADDQSKTDNYVTLSPEETKDSPKKDAGPDEYRKLTLEKSEEKNKERQITLADSVTSRISTKTTTANQVTTALGNTSSDYRNSEETPVGGGQGTSTGASAGASVVAKATTVTGGYYHFSGSTGNANISTASTNIDEAMKAYQAKDFQGAVDKFTKILLTDPGNTKALFYAGVSYLSLATPDTKHAIDNFDRVLVSEDASFGEASKWYKALALIKENNTAQAKPLLDEINNGKGVYKAKAASVLQDLNKAKKK